MSTKPSKRLTRKRRSGDAPQDKVPQAEELQRAARPDFGTRGRSRLQISLAEKSRCVCVIWTKLCQEETTQAQEENKLRALGEQHISEKPSNRKDPGIAPRQMAKKTVSTDSDYTFFMFVSSKRIKYGWFKKSSKSKLFRGNGKVNETEKETMSDRIAWLWI